MASGLLMVDKTRYAVHDQVMLGEGAFNGAAKW